MVDIKHAGARRLLGNRLLRLALRAHEEHRLAILREIGNEFRGVFEMLEGLLKIDDVDSVPLPVDVLLHLWVPAASLVAEMDAGLQKVFHRDTRQNSSLMICPSADGCRHPSADGSLRP